MINKENPKYDVPYKGLIHYSEKEEDASYFFGRESEREIISANLMASRLTIVYGESGVGKSSLLRAGVVYHLRKEIQENRNEFGKPEFAVLVYSDWHDNPVTGLVACVESAVADALRDDNLKLPSTSCGLVEILKIITGADFLNGQLFVILDQFEEFFFYQFLKDKDDPHNFISEFARAVNDPMLPVNFLISLREDALARLDIFKGAIPRLFDNYLRIDHLDREAAKKAIKKPIERYNTFLESKKSVSIEPELVEAVLNEVQSEITPYGPTKFDSSRSGIREPRIQAPYLQLVMTRIWQFDIRSEPYVLRLSSFKWMGMAKGIVGGYMDETMYALTKKERDIAGRVFQFLVTPSGTKFAHTIRDLSVLAHVPEKELFLLFEKLSGSGGSGIRILRSIAPPFGWPGETRYEIYHNALTPAIQSWQARYVNSPQEDIRYTRVFPAPKKKMTVCAEREKVKFYDEQSKTDEIGEFKAIKKAMQILAGAKADTKDMVAVIKELKASFQFGLARKILAKVSEKDPVNLWYKQQLALCTYNDVELPPAARFAKAISILEGIGLRDPKNKDAETLALGGAVFKRMWDFTGQLEHLYDALFFYRAAYERNPDQDLASGGINAAYILQILAVQALTAAKRSGTKPVEAERLEKQASDVREAIINQFTGLVEKDPSLKKKYWFVVTLAEAYFGLGKYKEAGEWLAISGKLDISEWKRQMIFKQLVGIARMQGAELPAESSNPETWHEAWQTLTNLLGEGTEAALSCYWGKVGLALSGGGFRASLYHLGVLARLAEMDVLRSVEVLSTVSGGSIVGAHYYLEVKNFLESKTDSEITRQDYIDIVRRIQKDFLDGVQQNIRVRTLADFKKNLKMIWSKNYGRSHRLGELYEELLYAKVQDKHPKGRPRRMHELLIQPKGDEGNFNPIFSNWRRRVKVPALLLNATSLNSGHNWRFTAKSMGEPPEMLGSEDENNVHYQCLWYSQAPTEDLKNYRLGYAVAASACIPEIFEPIALEGLYPETVVRLVDGGVSSNDGVEALINEGCTFILASNASSPMENQFRPSTGIEAVFMRTSSILLGRMREKKYEDLVSWMKNRQVGGLFYVQLKTDSYLSQLDWQYCQDPTEKNEIMAKLLPYGVDTELQRLIAGIRTDLDSFTDVEAYALMCSGYLMTEHHFQELQMQHERNGKPGTWGGYDVSAPWQKWKFLDLVPLLKKEKQFDTACKDLALQLKTPSLLSFKIWKMHPNLVRLTWLMVAGLVTVIIANWNRPLMSVSLTVGFLAALAVSIAMAKKLKLSLLLFGYLSAKIHLRIFDKMFLERGKLSQLLKKMGE